MGTNNLNFEISRSTPGKLFKMALSTFFLQKMTDLAREFESAFFDMSLTESHKKFEEKLDKIVF